MCLLKLTCVVGFRGGVKFVVEMRWEKRLCVCLCVCLSRFYHACFWPLSLSLFARVASLTARGFLIYMDLARIVRGKSVCAERAAVSPPLSPGRDGLSKGCIIVSWERVGSDTWLAEDGQSEWHRGGER